MRKERPILFSAPMVRAILDGRKTQTRRIYKVRRHPDMGCEIAASELVHEAQHVIERACPYGQTGDRLWVRETHAPQPDCLAAWDNWMIYSNRTGPKPIIHYAADGGDPWIDRWRPSIHMPRQASRITLEVTGVHIERLHAISESDARAEGARSADHATGRECVLDPSLGGYRLHYQDIWNTINGASSWDKNPWVWVVEFRRNA